MSALDPSYLRSIRDGILSGTIESNNIEALPDGLVGLYDKELFPPTLKWKERKETLKFFLVFALAQKEISADFAAEILGDEWYNIFDDNTSKEDKRLHRVNELIQVHSKRFSSAGGGKYRLYHERFRLYILQKVSEQDIAQFNDKFITLCEKALEVHSEKDIPEKESYALEFISTHYFMSAMQGEKECMNKEHAKELKKYAYDQQFWERQIKISKGFEWSKKMLNQMISWASKFNEDDEVLECALNKVDLYHQEQNDAPRIVQLVADGDIETALERIEKFGGDDKEGLQRKFILYMLCLMELTLLDSKDKENSKVSIEKLLKHLDEKMFINISLFDPNDWDIYFPDSLMFKIVYKLFEFGFDFKKIYKKKYDWHSINIDWIKGGIILNDEEKIFLKSLTSEEKFERLFSSKRKIGNDNLLKKDFELNEEQLFTNKINKLIEINNFIEAEYLLNLFLKKVRLNNENFILKCKKIMDIAGLCLKINKKLARTVMIEALDFSTSEFRHEGDIQCAREEIAIKIAKYGLINEYIENFILNKRLDVGSNDFILFHIVIQLSKQNDFNNSIKYLNLISSNNHYKEYALKQIIDNCCVDLKIKDTYKYLILSIQKNASYYVKYLIEDNTLFNLSKEFLKLKDPKRSFKCVTMITQGFSWNRNVLLKEITIEFVKQRKFKEAYISSKNIDIHSEFYKARIYIATELAKQGKIDVAIECLLDSKIESEVLINFAIEIFNLGFIDEANNIINECLLEIKSRIGSKETKIVEMTEILRFYLIQKDFQQASVILRDIYENEIESVEFALNNYQKSYHLNIIANEFRKLDKVEDYFTIKNKAIELLENQLRIEKDYLDNLDNNIELEIKNKTQDYIINGIYRDNINKLIRIASNISKFGRTNENNLFIKKAVLLVENISSNLSKGYALLQILDELFEQKKNIESHEITLMIIDFVSKIDLFTDDEIKFVEKLLKRVVLFNNELLERVSYLNPFEDSRLFLIKDLAKFAVDEIGTNKAISLQLLFRSNLMKIKYCEGIVETIDLVDVNQDLIKNLIFSESTNNLIIEILLTKYIIQQLFFSNLPQDKLNRYNRTLNLQWAIDIKNQLPN